MPRSSRAFRAAFTFVLLAGIVGGCRMHTVAPTSAASATTAPARSPRFLRSDSIDVIALLPDPPSAGSPENELEYETLQRAVATASDADKQRTRREIDMDVFVFGDVLGGWFTAQNCPHGAALFKQVGTDARYFSNTAKDHFNRLRPAPRADFQPLYPDPDPKVRGYPSGHSTRGTVWAELLAELYPAQREALLARGRQIGFDRMIAGVHYPTDIYAGRIVGRAVARRLLANGAFRAQLDQVKTEMDEAKSRGATVSTTRSASR